jgi:hypothetical protein
MKPPTLRKGRAEVRRHNSDVRLRQIEPKLEVLKWQSLKGRKPEGKPKAEKRYSFTILDPW